MILMDKKTTKRIMFQLATLWHYVKRLDDMKSFEIMTDALTAIAVHLGMDWDDVQAAEKVIATWGAFQSGDL